MNDQLATDPISTAIIGLPAFHVVRRRARLSLYVAQPVHSIPKPRTITSWSQTLQLKLLGVIFPMVLINIIFPMVFLLGIIFSMDIGTTLTLKQMSDAEYRARPDTCSS